MAFVGPWGVYYHVPKCGGMGVRVALAVKYHDQGREVGGRHSLPGVTDDAFTFVRHPADWLRSFYAYASQHAWVWPELPDAIRNLFNRSWMWGGWSEFVRSVTRDAPGIVGVVYDLYCVPGVEVHRLEDKGLPIVHATPDKPNWTTEEIEMITEAEEKTIARYGYSVVEYKS